MAVLPAHPGIKVSIVCNGAALQEYDDEDEKAQAETVFKYVEAVSGAEFEIKSELSPPWPTHTVLLKCYLDRKLATSRFTEQINHSSQSKTQTIVEGSWTKVDGQTYLHKFAFAALTIDDTVTKVDTRVLKDIKGVGEVTVKAYFVENLRDCTKANEALRNNIDKIGKIPEKALKGQSLSHQTCLRTAQPTTPFGTSTCDYIDPEKQPFAIYTFKYRSRDALKSLLVIPRSPRPVPLEERDVNTLTAEEMRELLLRLRERDAAARAAKQERGIKRERPVDRSSALPSDVDDDEASIVLTKRRREKYRTTVNEAGHEEIDLT